MPKVKEILVRKEWNGQVWYETKPVEKDEEKDEKTSLDPFPRCQGTPDTK